MQYWTLLLITKEWGNRGEEGGRLGKRGQICGDNKELKINKLKNKNRLKYRGHSGEGKRGGGFGVWDKVLKG